MSSDPSTLVERVRNLTPEQMDALSRLLDAIEAGPTGPSPDAEHRPLAEFAFFGMWADREDMKDGGAAWVRKLRETEWRRPFDTAE